MTYNVFGGTLNLALYIYSNFLGSWWQPNTTAPYSTAKVWIYFLFVQWGATASFVCTSHFAHLKLNLHNHHFGIPQSRSTTSLSWSWRKQVLNSSQAKRKHQLVYLIIELADEFQVTFVFKLMVDGLLKHNTLALLGHQQTQWYGKVVF